jgi:hypothetical protein
MRRGNVTSGDWMRLRCGDVVREIDGRHYGRVEAIHNGSTVKIKWEDSGWISFVALDDIERFRRA